MFAFHRMDFDFYSVKARVEDLIRLSPTTFTLCSHRLHRVKDSRVEHLLQIASSPMCIFADVEKEVVLAALEIHGVLVHPHAQPTVLSSTTSFPVTTDKLALALRDSGVSHVYCYSYGCKASTSGVFYDVVDLVSVNGGAHDNLFDIGTSVQDSEGPFIPLFRIPRSLGGKAWASLQSLEHGFGDVRFERFGLRVTRYQKLTHAVKALGPRIDVPESFKEVHNLHEKYIK